MAVNPGDILPGRANRYRVDALIGRGGMGHVFSATALEGPAPPVAIKVVSRLLFDATLMARLHREAEAAALIRSEYVPRVLEVSNTDDMETFLVMERLVGEPLSQRMRSMGPLPWSEVVQIGEDVLRGLIDAHTAGVVHRDLKPSNIFLALKGGRVRAMVLDFGVCKMDSVDAQHLTGTGESIGTVAYMAPEQIRGAARVDDRADLYAFGVLVFEMVCGRLPHDGPSQMAILASKLEKPPARVYDAARVPVPADLDALVARALLLDPKGRFTSAQDLLKAWRKLGPANFAAAPAAAADADVSDHDPHDAPTAQLIGPSDETAQGSTDIFLPREAHPTQTALTGALLLPRNGGSGRVAFLLAACALVTGAICVAVFFARGPEHASEVESVLGNAPVPSASVPITSAVEPPTAEPVLVGIGPPAEGSAPSSAERVAPRVRRAAPRSSAPAITSQPRY